MIQASAPAKIILLGEHAVVYNQPAIAIPVSHLRAKAEANYGEAGSGLQIVAVDLGLTIPVTSETGRLGNPLYEIARLVLDKLEMAIPDLVIRVQSDIPLASGLGSGAAISAVIARALSTALHRPLENDELNDLVYQIEKLHHGTPSGIDNTVIVYERPVYFVRGQEKQFFSVKGRFHFLIADTGISALTRNTVAAVKKLYEEQRDHYSSVFNLIGDLVLKAREALETGDLIKLGSLMNENHLHLQHLTVSSPELDRLVNAAQDAGALGAKLSGGGRGGNMIALCSEEAIPVVRDSLLRAGAARVFYTVLE